MAKDKRSKYKIIISPADDDNKGMKIEIPLNGEKEKDADKILEDAYKNACTLLDDANKVDGLSRIILTSLSCELLLKSILLKTNGVASYTHDLYDLYCELKPEYRDLLLSQFNIGFDKETIEKFIIMNALNFISFRYRHEISTIIYSEGFVYELAQKLKYMYLDL